ncbi:UDP-N-acetyl-D-mannosaminuronic acid transferase [Methylobrevis pamukkalensis]|uniref:UDP-N-acetyl-D-mannosaminuronic acid transferase n=2 Tax=Methylobrevis pamukkalensis TaxID=1439726 RepID=A0A1E3H4X6_9HYPH|nr:UDP-N-acetyl-D-mannosaminuronic acid transferase [Methylobrevis pamukkalensis]
MTVKYAIQSLTPAVGTDERLRAGVTGPELVETSLLGGLPIAVIDRARSAALMIEWAMERRGKGLPPIYVTSANGQVISNCATDPEIRALFDEADLIHADGNPMVAISRFKCAKPIPERAATTDLVHDVARLAELTGARFYFIGGSPEVARKAEENMRALYPRLEIVGARDGYFKKDEEDAVVAAINAARPDILWIGFGVPLEQRFISRNRDRLTGVGLVKTSGGLFDFLSGAKSRAPKIMQSLGLEWLYRAILEPRRLGKRYLTTNPHALWLLLTSSR